MNLENFIHFTKNKRRAKNMTVEEFKDLFEKEIAYPVENEAQNLK